MTKLAVRHLTKELVVLSWQFVPGAMAYSIMRADPPGDDGEHPPPVLLATCYTPTFCDATLEPGQRYVYQLDAMPDPDGAGLEDGEEMEADRQRLAVRTLPETEFPDSVAFFADFLRKTFPRRLDEGTRWCESWMAHPEAAFVVKQLWAAYEALRPPQAPGEPPTRGHADWLVSYAYPLLDRLLLERGPFVGCSISQHEISGVMHDPAARDLLHRPPLDTAALSSPA